MIHRLRLAGLLSSTALLAAISLPAGAQSAVVHLPLDGSVNSIGSAGSAMLIVPEGADQPKFVEGQFEQGLSFGKGGAIAIPYEFNQADNPRATITMWVKVNADSTYERELFSLGPGNGLLLTLTNRRQITVRSGRQLTHVASIPLGEWVFVSAVVDNEAGLIDIRQNSDVRYAENLDIRTPNSLPVKAPGAADARHYIFVGAADFAGREERRVSLDDVRLYPEALTVEQRLQIRDASSPFATGKTEIGVTEKNAKPDVPVTAGDITARPGINTERPVLPASGDPEGDTSGASRPPITTLPDDGPRISSGLPPADEAQGGGQSIDTDVHDMSNAKTKGINGPTGLSRGAPDGATVPDEPEAEQPAELQPQDGDFVPVGPEFVTPLTGRSGDIERRIDLASQGVFISAVTWGESADRPCSVRITGSKINTSYVSLLEGLVDSVHFKCGNHVFGSSKTVSLNVTNPVKSASVCNTSASNRRMKGLRLSGGFINPDDPDAPATSVKDSESTPNCAAWSPEVSCPDGQRATGLSIVSRDVGGNGRGAITGLRLICHEVGIR